MLAIVLAIALEAQDAEGILVAIGFLIGGTFSGAAGFIGMNVSVRANARVAESARSGVSRALEVAFKGGAITGLLVAGLALLGVAGYYGILILFDVEERDAIDALIGLGFGGSLISVFARLGGGIFTKAADVGADLVGKIEAGIPEDDPRNPAVIADNVGDNVGDCAGMAADLFETYAVTAVAVMLLGVLTFDQIGTVAVYPLVIGGVSLIASIIGTYAVRSAAGNVERALYQGLIVSAVLAALAFLPITLWMMDDLTFKDEVSSLLRGGSGEAPSGIDLYLCTLVGIGDHRRPVRDHRLLHVDALPAGAHHRPRLADGARDQHHPGARTGLPVDRRAGDPAGARHPGRERAGRDLRHRRGRDGAALADRPDRGSRRVRPDHRQRRRHRRDGRPAGGGPQRDRPARRGRQHHQGGDQGLRDRLGRARGARAVRGLHRGAAGGGGASDGTRLQGFDISQPEVLIGLLIGGMMVYLFAALAIEAVGRAGGGVVEEVRRQFKEKPGIMDCTEKPDYRRAVDIVTASAQREMILPALIPIVVPVVVGLLSYQALGGLLIGVIVVGFFAAISMTSGGGAWDNAKKLIEDGEYGGKGSEAHAASVTGDTVGDPYKDTAGPAINPMIKVANIVALLIIPFLV